MLIFKQEIKQRTEHERKPYQIRYDKIFIKRNHIIPVGMNNDLRCYEVFQKHETNQIRNIIEQPQAVGMRFDPVYHLLQSIHLFLQLYYFNTMY